MTTLSPRKTFVILWFAAAVVGFAVEAPLASVRLLQGDHSLTLTVGNLERRYLVHVPPGYDGVKPVPVVVMLHGGGGTSRAAAVETGWSAKADKDGFLVVFPDAMPPDPSKPGHFARNPQLWNDGSERFFRGQNAVDDVGFLNAMLDDLLLKFAVDTQRVFVTGFSNGASMSFRFGAEASRRIAAIAPVAGACWANNVTLERPVPMCYITGMDDPLNRIEGGVPKLLRGGSDSVRAKAKPPVRDSITKWAKAIGCPATPASTSEANGVRTERYDPGHAGAEVVYIAVEGLGHTWAGGKSLLPEFMVGKCSNRLNATDAIWEFFRKHSVPLARSVAATFSPASMEAARRYSESAGGQAMLVMLDGKVLFEGYANGGGPERKQMLASGSKCFVGVAAAAAVEDGHIRFDDPACRALVEWKDDPTKSRITYRQLLTLTSGLTPGERGHTVIGPAWTDIIAKPLVAEPGAKFAYGAYHLNAFALALERSLKNETFETYLERRVLRPLGIALEWRFRCVDNHPQVGGGAFMTARDWAAFGEFMRLGGRWEGKQVIRRELLAESLQGTKQNPAYGLTWWLREPVPDAIIRQVPILHRDMGEIVTSEWLPDDLFMAAGAGKQRLYVFPSLKLVVVRLGNLRASRGFSDNAFLDRLLRDGSER